MAGLDPAIAGLQGSWAGISPLVDGAGFQGLCLQGPQLVPVPSYGAGCVPGWLKAQGLKVACLLVMGGALS